MKHKKWQLRLEKNPLRPQSYTNKYRKLRKAWHGRGSLLQGAPNISPVPNISSKNVHTGSIIQAVQAIFRNIYVCLYICVK